MNTQPLLQPTPPAGEEERVNQIFAMAEDIIGFVPAGLRLYGISPPLLEAFAGNVHYFRSETQLSPVLTTLIRYLGSDRAGCQFCIDLNETFLRSMEVDMDAVNAARDDIDAAPLPDKEKTLLKIAMQGVTSPDEVSQANIDAAKEAGCNEREIFDAVVQAAANRAFNLVLKTFNVESQEDFV